MLKRSVIVLIACAALFFVGRFTAPKPVINDNKQDSLVLRIKQLQKLKEVYEVEAKESYQKGIDHQNEKLAERERYFLNRERKHKLTLAKKDSIIRSALGLQSDTSVFTHHAVNEIMDLNDKKELLEKEVVLDSLTIGSLKQSNASLDSALKICDEQLEAKAEIVLEVQDDLKDSKKEIKKQKRLKWLAIVLGLIGTGVALNQ